jgi:peptidoglycan L-alanyl-D-glutamate endopeptidase CwlK
MNPSTIWAGIQRHLGIKDDGIPGPKTAQAIADFLKLQPATPQSAPAFDERSQSNIATLLPQARDLCRKWLSRCLAEGIRVRVISGTRSHAEQAALYAKGRTTKGPKVTNARPGYSWHNFGVAWDFVVFDAQGQPDWNSPLMTRCGKIGEELGLEWGGSWSGFKDIPHLQLRTGLSLEQARARHAAGKPLL